MAYWVNTLIDISDEAKLASYVELASRPCARRVDASWRAATRHTFEGGTAAHDGHRVGHHRGRRERVQQFWIPGRSAPWRRCPQRHTHSRGIE
jgi:hypothetical protein